MKNARRWMFLLPLGLALAPVALAQQTAPALQAPPATPPVAQPAAPAVAPSASTAPKPNTGWVAANPAVDCAGVKDRLLCSDLLSMRDRDQSARRDQLAHPSDKEVAAAAAQVDGDNQRRLDAIIHDHRWPSAELVGRKASAASWTIIQHADLAYQKKYVELMTEAANSGNLSWALLATTIDRIRVREGKQQVYGSQFHEVKGELVSFPIEDEAHVDERRAKVGLQPLAEYATMLRGFFKQQKAAAQP
jgi:hypothetical protein